MANKEQVYAKISEAIAAAESGMDKRGYEAVEYAVHVIKKTFGIPCEYVYCGGFDSPGYAVSCYAIAYVTSEGGLGLYDYQYEIY
ncbi:hypothetical protein [Brevibacillus reuszeri]|uniref:hypothetical protein n=1 Tax=Brevibacillus reuszeri TaxID=54915 RepID=UPI000CCC09F0|nr:hypothetical protein [Brevibacillus reuszeri]